jgi:hypothetical protein
MQVQESCHQQGKKTKKNFTVPNFWRLQQACDTTMHVVLDLLQPEHPSSPKI